MVDLHFHVLHGIDDGPDSLSEAVRLVRAAIRTGIVEIVATPHVSWRYDNSSAAIGKALVQLNNALVREALVPDKMRPIRQGAEIAATRIPDLDDRELSALALGAGSWLLVEPPFAAAVSGLDGVVADLHRRGYRVLLAHPERCPAFHRDPELLRRLIDAGALTSITAGALVGRFGGAVQRYARALAEAGLIHNVASDAHDLRTRPPGIAAELESAGLAPLAEWLTQQVPRAILDGAEAIPPRPSARLSLRGRKWRWPRMRLRI